MGFHALLFLLIQPFDKAFNQSKSFGFVIIHGMSWGCL